jgi:hypothetical protein
MKQWLLKLLGILGEYLKVLFDSAIKAELEVIMPIATNIVKQVAKDPTLLSSSAKRDAAIAGILAEITAAQVQVGNSIINLAVELAYQNIKQTNK